METATDLDKLINEIAHCKKLTPETKRFLYRCIAANYIANHACEIFNEFAHKVDRYYSRLEKKLQHQQTFNFP